MLRHQSLRGIVKVEISVSASDPACCGGCPFMDVTFTNHFACTLFSSNLDVDDSVRTDCVPVLRRCADCISAFGGVK